MRKRGGAFALITYILYALFSVAAFLFVHLELLEGIAIPGVGFIILILEMFAYILAFCSVLLLVFKLLHMVTRFALFAIPCLLADAYMIWHLVPRIISMDAITVGMLIMILWLLLSLGCFVSNLMSF